ncbi:MAG: ribosome-associated translation inhibitor RaiA [Chitinophagaceae bacterium]|nr:MAG: ribosome-associated translation inhibitor RaiA [Chitinophagaceae bacterium]
MEIKIQSIHFDADQKLLQYIEKKLEKLQNINDQVIHVDVFLRLENAGSSVKDKTSEIKINIPGSTLFSKDTAKTFEESVDGAVESMRRQLKKSKEKFK